MKARNTLFSSCSSIRRGAVSQSPDTRDMSKLHQEVMPPVSKGGHNHNGDRPPAMPSAHRPAPAQEDFNFHSIRPEWNTWGQYEKTVADGPSGKQEYVELAGRLYSRHAVQSMNVKGLGYAAGDPAVGSGKKSLDGSSEYGGSISPRLIDFSLRYGTVSRQGHLPGTSVFVYGDVEVIATDDKKIVISAYVNENK